MKQQLRKLIKAETVRYTQEELHQMSCDICQRILDNNVVRNASVILAFWPMPSEPDIRPAIHTLYAQGKTILLPRVISRTEMEFCPYLGDESLHEVPPYGILEPVTPAVEDISIGDTPDQTVILVPGLAFDAEGNRLGHGAGYYDRYLADGSITKIGVCFPFQIVEHVPTGEYDVKVNAII